METCRVINEADTWASSRSSRTRPLGSLLPLSMGITTNLRCPGPHHWGFGDSEDSHHIHGDHSLKDRPTPPHYRRESGVA